MPRIVMKFGGTSMAGIERIRHVAERVRREAEAGNQVLVVVSAMAGETDRLVQLCREASALSDPKEYDVVVASGEQVTSGLLALTLQALGCKARSWLGWQLPVHTMEAHAKARISSIESDDLLASMAAGEIAGLDWLGGLAETDMAEFRQDRFAAAVTWTSDQPFRLAYRVRAVTPGSYARPAATVEDMYRPERRGWTDSGRVEITR